MGLATVVPWSAAVAQGPDVVDREEPFGDGWEQGACGVGGASCDGELDCDDGKEKGSVDELVAFEPVGDTQVRVVPIDDRDWAAGANLDDFPQVGDRDVSRAVEEARAFLAAVKDDRLYPAWLLLLSRGPRRGELAGLRWGDVDLEAKVAKIAVTRVAVGGKATASTPKTAAGTRSLSLDPSLVAVLKDHRKHQLEERMAWGAGWTDCGLVFVREDGAPLSPESISQRFERLCKRVGARRIRLHDLRHTAASLALADGVPVKVVSEMIGHGDVRVTLAIYQHTTAQMHVEAGARLTGQLLGGVQ